MKTDRETQEVKDRLLWLANHPGEWLRWARSHGYPVSARHVRPPAFERMVISTQSYRDGYGPNRGLEPGLWVRFVGVPCGERPFAHNSGEVLATG